MHSSKNNDFNNDPVRRLVLCGLFIALTVVGTLLGFPIAGGQGFLNLGDAVIHTAAYLIGGWHAAAVAGLGSAAADLILGYSMYIPGSLLVKGAMALFCSFLLGKLRYKQEAVFISGLVMPVGYFLYELLLSFLGVFDPRIAVFDLPFNAIQYAVGAFIGCATILLISKFSRS